MEDFIQPSFNTRPYDVSKTVAIRDRYQQFLYLKHQAYPVDMYVSVQKGDLVMVFDKDETKELYEKYRRYELE